MILNIGGSSLSKWAVVNALWLALLGACWHQGWLQYVFDKDVTYISHGIGIASLLVLILCFWKQLRLSRLMSRSELLIQAYAERVLKAGADRRAEVREALRNELMSYGAVIEYFATFALAVGVLGTVVGLVMGFSTLNPADVANPDNAGPAVAQLLRGLSVAFHTTLVGGIANLWLRTNHFLLMQSSVSLYNKVLEGK